MDKYTILIEADETGFATVKRISDGKSARVKVAWMKPIGGGDCVPRSRTKAIRLQMLDWE